VCFALYLARRALPAPALRHAIASLAGPEAMLTADHMDQVDRVEGGTIRELRRSRVVRLGQVGCTAHADLCRWSSSVVSVTLTRTDVSSTIGDGDLYDAAEPR